MSIIIINTKLAYVSIRVVVCLSSESLNAPPPVNCCFIPSNKPSIVVNLPPSAYAPTSQSNSGILKLQLSD